ncbi:MAG: hypothetical protein ACOC56_01920 [Atribacterota bacterium]
MALPWEKSKSKSKFSDPNGQTKATPDHQKPSGGGQSRPSSGGRSSRKSKAPSKIYKSELLKQSFKSKIAKQKAEQKFKEQQKKEAQQKQKARQEQQRIKKAKQELRKEDAKKKTKIIKNKKGQKIKQTIIKGKNKSIVENLNLKTGEFRQLLKIEGKTVGGISEERFSRKQIKEKAKKELPAGDSYIYDSKRGKIRGIRSKKLKKTFPYTKKGIEEYKKQLRKKTKTKKDQVKQIKQAGTVTKAKRAKFGIAAETIGLGKLRGVTTDFSTKLRTKKLRGNFSPREEALLVGSAFSSGVIDAFSGLVDLPETAIRSSSYLAKNPSEIKKIPKNIDRAGKKFGYLMRVSPAEGLAYVGGNIAGLKGSSKALNILSKASGKTISKLNPRSLGNVKTGQKINIKVSPKKSVPVEIVGKIPKEKLAKQISLSGKKVNAISSQADDLFKILRKKKVVRKPIRGESTFRPVTKKLLKKFDQGNINKKELIQLDAALRAEGTKGLLERSFFADPSGKIRPSRLGIVDDIKGQKGKKILDYLSEDITFKKPKPAIYMLDDVQVEKFPKNLKSVASKLKRGGTLSESEANKLLQFQLKKSGKFKPLGFVSGESEITLAPGELLRKVKKLGSMRVDGNKVKVIKVKPYTPKGNTAKLLNKLNRGKITRAERIKLKKLLKKETGINYGSSYVPGKKYVNIKYLGLSSAGRLSKRLTRKPSRLKRKPSKPSKPGKPSKPSKPSKPGKPPSKPPRKYKSKDFNKKKLPSKRLGYYVVVKRGGKKVKLNPKPLVKEDAKDFLAYRIDKGLSRTAYFVPTGKTKEVIQLPRGIKGYFNRNKKKFRGYKIRRGSKKGIQRGYIEKKKYVGDTKSEIRQLQKSKGKSKRKSKSKKSNKKSKSNKKKRKISPAQRKVLLKRLEKARRAKRRKNKK